MQQISCNKYLTNGEALYQQNRKDSDDINHHDVTYKLTKLKKKLKFMKLFIPECSVMGDEVALCCSAKGFVTMCIF